MDKQSRTSAYFHLWHCLGSTIFGDDEPLVSGSLRETIKYTRIGQSIRTIFAFFSPSVFLVTPFFFFVYSVPAVLQRWCIQREVSRLLSTNRPDYTLDGYYTTSSAGHHKMTPLSESFGFLRVYKGKPLQFEIKAIGYCREQLNSNMLLSNDRMPLWPGATHGLWSHGSTLGDLGNLFTSVINLKSIVRTFKLRLPNSSDGFAENGYRLIDYTAFWCETYPLSKFWGKEWDFFLPFNGAGHALLRWSCSSWVCASAEQVGLKTKRI